MPSRHSQPELIPLFAVDSGTGVRAHDELYGRYVARGRLADPHAVRRQARRPVLTTEAKLFGGVADGHTVELVDLSPEIAVFIDEAGTSAIDARLAERGQGSPAGVYRLVNPHGPEVPTYVAPSL
jgi:hypothetical protein